MSRCSLLVILLTLFGCNTLPDGCFTKEMSCFSCDEGMEGTWVIRTRSQYDAFIEECQPHSWESCEPLPAPGNDEMLVVVHQYLGGWGGCLRPACVSATKNEIVAEFESAHYVDDDGEPAHLSIYGYWQLVPSSSLPVRFEGLDFPDVPLGAHDPCGWDDELCWGYTGENTECCRGGDPCGLEDNLICECGPACLWDHEDCGIGAQVQFSGVDILVVVDNSTSMAEEQASLAASFPLLIQSLLNPPDLDGDTMPDHVPVRDLHIGVVSTDMGTGGYSVDSCSDPIDGDNGELQHTPNPSIAGCESAYPTYLSYESEEPDIPAIDRMATGFGCIATLGHDGCGWEQPLKAAGRALIDHRDGVNAGFLRPDSILAILFVSDEDDCSVALGSEGIFDTLDASLGHMDLRCFNHPDMVEPVATYITALESLRADPDRLVLGFIVGVPPGEQCEGDGSEITPCLDHPDMIERVDMPTTSILPACTTSSGSAPPGRRFVEIAQSFGESALVQSICTDDFDPAIQALTDRLHEVVDSVEIVHEMPTMKDPEDACRCLAFCKVIESLSDTRSCDTVGKPCYEPDGPGTGCAPNEVGPDGLEHTLCEIPQAGTRMSPCTVVDPPECDDPGVTHSIDGLGWYYYGRNWSDGTTTYVEPQILFTEGMEPEEGSNVYIQCGSVSP